ncbi:MAG: hypothetical protein ACYDCK_14215, partial [Thermoplasmatota archaeon]
MGSFGVSASERAPRVQPDDASLGPEPASLDVRTTARGAAASDGRRANAYIACVIAAAAATIAVMTWFVIARVPLTFEGG